LTTESTCKFSKFKN